jgi:hypothetical protein
MVLVSSRRRLMASQTPIVAASKPRVRGKQSVVQLPPPQLFPESNINIRALSYTPTCSKCQNTRNK